MLLSISINSQIIMALINQLVGKSDLKVEIPKFKGAQDAYAFIEVDQIFQFKHTLFDRKVDRVVLRLSECSDLVVKFSALKEVM